MKGEQVKYAAQVQMTAFRFVADGVSFDFSGDLKNRKIVLSGSKDVVLSLEDAQMLASGIQNVIDVIRLGNDKG